jgi:hypothetical protein
MALRLETDSSEMGSSSQSDIEEETKDIVVERVPEFEKSLRRDRRHTLILPTERDVAETESIIP